MKLGPIARALAASGLCLCVLSLVMTARALFEARAEQAEAELALSAGDVDAAIAGLRRSARWNAPGNFYAQDSLAMLERLANGAETRGDHVRALSANRAIHAAIHASRGFYPSERELLARTDDRIATLMAREPPPEIDAARSVAERRAQYLTLLKGQRPRSGGVLVAFAGFLTWVVAAAVFLLRGVDERGRVVRRVARRSGVMLLLGWIAFALGLRLA
jgi:hypothetical protein